MYFGLEYEADLEKAGEGAKTSKSAARKRAWVHEKWRGLDRPGVFRSPVAPGSR